MLVSGLELPETQVIAVRTTSSHPAAYAEAFGKLVGYYAQPSAKVQVVFPQQSITLHTINYATVAVAGPVMPTQGIERLTLPSCRFLSAHYIGGYDGIGMAIAGLVNQAIAQNRQIDARCGVRIHHLNSPDNTPIEKLAHLLYVPVTKPKP